VTRDFFRLRGVVAGGVGHESSHTTIPGAVRRTGDFGRAFLAGDFGRAFLAGDVARRFVRRNENDPSRSVARRRRNRNAPSCSIEFCFFGVFFFSA